jgi:hypothetical protein
MQSRTRSTQVGIDTTPTGIATAEINQVSQHGLGASLSQPTGKRRAVVDGSRTFVGKGGNADVYLVYSPIDKKDIICKVSNALYPLKHEKVRKAFKQVRSLNAPHYMQIWVCL